MHYLNFIKIYFNSIIGYSKPYSTNTTNTQNQRLESPALGPLDSIQPFESATSASSSSSSSNGSSSSSSMFSSSLMAFGRGTTVTLNSRGGRGRGLRGNGCHTKY